MIPSHPRSFLGLAVRGLLTTSALLAPLAAARIQGQHLNLAVIETTQTQAELLRAATSPERFARFTGEPALLHASAHPEIPAPLTEPALAEAAESSSFSWPESPSSLLATNPEPVTAPPQFPPLNPNKVPRSANDRPIAPLHTKYIPAGWDYLPIHGRDKLILGAQDLYSPSNFIAMIFAAGWSHVTNGQPNYGTDRGAFGQRLGAAAIRQTAQGIFTDGVFSVLFHQDPRYFAEGPKYGFVHRALYAATRPIIVRTTNGTGSTINSSLLAGYAAAAILNDAYYPSSNRNVHDTLASYGGSLGGAALGFVVSEFTDDALQALHLKHKP